MVGESQGNFSGEVSSKQVVKCHVRHRPTRGFKWLGMDGGGGFRKLGEVGIGGFLLAISA